MSAEPPDSRGMGWVWKCLSMSDTVWNHKWCTWHCPFSFTDRRKCWEGEGRERGGDRTLTMERQVKGSKGWRGRGVKKKERVGKENDTTQKDRELQCETQWASETDRPRQRSGHSCEASRCGSKVTECQGWHQRKRRQLTLPQHRRLAGCDVQRSCYIRAHKTMTLLHLFHGLNNSEQRTAMAASQNVLRRSLSEFNAAVKQKCSWEEGLMCSSAETASSFII